METTTTITGKATGERICDMPVIDIDGWGEVLLFPSAQELWNFQAGLSFRDEMDESYGQSDIVYGERADRELRDLWGYDADEAYLWIANGMYAFLDTRNAVIVGAQ